MPTPRKALSSPPRPFIPDREAVASAQEMVHALRDNGSRFVILDKQTDAQTEINEDIYRLFMSVLYDLAKSRPITIIPTEHEVTTYQAASILNVSRPYVIKLIEQNELPHRLVGTHRRIRLEDLLEYKEKLTARSDKAMDELAELTQQLNLE